MNPHLFVDLVNITMNPWTTHEIESEILAKRQAKTGYDFRPKQKQFR